MSDRMVFGIGVIGVVFGSLAAWPATKPATMPEKLPTLRYTASQPSDATRTRAERSEAILGPLAALESPSAVLAATPTPRPRPWTGPRPVAYVWVQEVMSEPVRRTYRMIALPRDPFGESLTVTWAVARYQVRDGIEWRDSNLPPPILSTETGVSQRVTVDLTRQAAPKQYRVFLDVAVRTADGERYSQTLFDLDTTN